MTAVTAMSLLLTPASWADPAPSPTDRSGPSAGGVACTIDDPRITEASGLAATSDRLYLVNDGGDRLTVFVLDRRCQVQRVIHGATDPYDVEDLARGQDGTLWLADSGDNRTARDSVALETITPGGSSALYRFTYPDGAHDAEALLLDRSGRPYLVTKSALGVSAVYTPAEPWSTTASTPLRRVTTLRFRFTGTSGGPVGAVSQLLVTGGAVSADGTRVALRTYNDLYLWSAPDGDIGAALRDGHRTRVRLPEEKQGEAVAFVPDGRSVLTTSEGTPAPVHAVALPPAKGSVKGGATASSTSTLSPSAQTRTEQQGGHDGGSRSVLVNLVLACLIATAIMIGLGRLRRRK